jgi:hypothetical protein
MADSRRSRRTFILVGLATAAAVPAFLLGSSPQQTEASWLVTKTAAVTATAVTPAAPTALTCGAGSGGLFSSIPFTWTAPAGTAPSGYTLKWTGATTGSTTSTTTSGSVPSSALLGTITVSVYSDYGSWQSLAGTQTRKAIILVIGTLWGCS